MSPISKGLASAAIAAVLSSAAGAQGLVSQKNILLALAQCQSMGLKVSVMVVDRDGLPIAMIAATAPACTRPKAPTARHIPHARSVSRRPLSPSGWWNGRTRSVRCNIAACWRSPAACDQVRRRGGGSGRRLGLARQRRHLLAGRHRQGRRSVQVAPNASGCRLSRSTASICRHRF